MQYCSKCEFFSLLPYISCNVSNESLVVHQNGLLVDDFLYSHHLSVGNDDVLIFN